MKTRLLTLAAAVLLPLPVVSLLPAAPAVADRAATLLATHDSIPVQAAGPYVEHGSFRIHVAAHLGRPDAALPDGTWIYHQRGIAGSGATGSLVVHFDAHGRVRELRLGTPAHVAELGRLTPAPPGERLARR